MWTHERRERLEQPEVGSGPVSVSLSCPEFSVKDRSRRGEESRERKAGKVSICRKTFPHEVRVQSSENLRQRVNPVLNCFAAVLYKSSERVHLASRHRW